MAKRKTETKRNGVSTSHFSNHLSLMRQLRRKNAPRRPALKLESKMPMVMKRLSQSN
jgi:hypothetical protein